MAVKLTCDEEEVHIAWWSNKGAKQINEGRRVRHVITTTQCPHYGQMCSVGCCNDRQSALQQHFVVLMVVS